MFKDGISVDILSEECTESSFREGSSRGCRDFRLIIFERKSVELTKWFDRFTSAGSHRLYVSSSLPTGTFNQLLWWKAFLFKSRSYKSNSLPHKHTFNNESSKVSKSLRNSKARLKKYAAKWRKPRETCLFENKFCRILCAINHSNTFPNDWLFWKCF